MSLLSGDRDLVCAWLLACRGRCNCSRLLPVSSYPETQADQGGMGCPAQLAKRNSAAKLAVEPPANASPFMPVDTVRIATDTANSPCVACNRLQ